MTPEIKKRIEQIQWGERPEGYVRDRKALIPNGWEYCPIKNIATVSSGSTPARNNPEYWNGDISWVTTGELESGHIVCTIESVSKQAVENLHLTVYPKGTLLMAMYGQGKTRGTVAMLEIDATINQACAAITPKRGETKFLFFLLQNAYKDIRKLSNTGNQQNLNADIIKAFHILWAPDTEQEKIAAILTTQDKIIELKEKLIAEKQRQKKYLMQQLLTGKKRLLMLDGEWKKVGFNEIFTFGNTNTFSREFMDQDLCGPKNIHYGDVLVKYSEILNVSNSDIPALTPEAGNGVKEYAANGDIVIADTAEDLTAGKAVEIQNIGTVRVAAGLHTMLCKPARGYFVPGWLGYFMNSEYYHNQLIPYIAGVKVMSISKGNILKTHLLVPSLQEQKMIVTILSAADQEISLLQQSLEQEKQKKKALMQLLLTGIVRVNV